jgi:sortase A
MVSMKKTKKIYLPMILVVIGVIIILSSLSDIWDQKKQQSKMLDLVKSEIQNAPKREEFVEVQEEKNKGFHIGDVIGVLNIPSIQKQLPIIEGANEEELEKGVGHLTSTAFPGEKNQIVLSGHRDTVFRKVGKLKSGDELQIIMEGGVFTYIIRKTYIVDKDDRTVIKPTYPHEILILSTCYPFSFLGNAPQRYIIEAER